MKSFFKKFGVVLAVVILAVGCVFLPFKNSQNLTAHADTVENYYSYYSNHFYTLNVPIYNYSSSGSSLPVLYHINIRQNSSDGLVYFNPALLVATGAGTGANGAVYYEDYSHLAYRNDLTTEWNDYTFVPAGERFVHLDYDTPYSFIFLNSRSYTSAQHFRSYIYIQDGFIPNIYRVRIYVKKIIESQNFSAYRNSFLRFEYYDVNDKYFSISFIVNDDFIFNDRTYYINNTDDLTENQLYNQGYQEGLKDNQSRIYNNGFSAGQTAGYNSGYNAGVISANDYSFIGLISSVVDVPFQTFRGALNYDLLGVNLFNLFTSLLTLGIVLFILKKLLGGR